MAKKSIKNQKIKKYASLSALAFGLAALPVAGVFAIEGDGIMKHKDELTISILPVCTLGTLDENGKAMQYATPATDDATSQTPAVAANDSTTHGNDTWAIGSTITGNGVEGYRTDTFSYTMQPGQKEDTLATTTFTIRCNNSGGYTLSAVGNNTAGNAVTDLTSGDNKIETGTADSWTSDLPSYWNMRAAKGDLSGNNGGNIVVSSAAPNNFTVAHAIPSSDAIIASSSVAGSVSDGEKVTVTYGIGININQPAGSYTGSVLYTLAQLDTGGVLSNGDSSTGGGTVENNGTEGGGTDQSQGGTGTNGAVENNGTEGGSNDDEGGSESQAPGRRMSMVSNSYNNNTTNNTTNNNTYNTYNTTENYYEQGGTSTPTLAQVQEKPDEEEEAEKDSAKDGYENPLGAMSSTGGTVASVAMKKDEDGGNFVLPVALAVAGTAAALGAGVYAYKKSQEEE